jgi:Mrp family chromosome partitioning ATPase
VELRPYIDVLRRRIWFVLEAVVIVAVVAGVGSSLRPAKYTSSARMYLQPDSPAEQLNPGQLTFRDPVRFVQAQIDILGSEAVAREAAKVVGGLSAKDVERRTSVRSSSTSDVLEVSATDGDPDRARRIADAVVSSYIENRRRSAVAGLERAAKDLDERLAPLNAELADIDARIAALPAADRSAAAGQQLLALREATLSQYETLFSRRQELAVDISLQRGGAEVIAEATMPTAPVSPRPVRDAAAGALFGGILGAGIVLLREQLDDKLRSVEEVERALSVPILAQLPMDDGAGSGVAAIAHPHSPLSEAVRSLRTSVQYTGLDKPLKTIVVTSAMPAEGKSVVSANLAAACAVAGHRTVLVGADLRRPRLSALFDVKNGAGGLSEIVAGVNGAGPEASGMVPARAEGPAQEKANTTGGVASKLVRPIANLAFLPAGRPPPNPAELLGSRRMKSLLGELTAGADVVVIDTPPLLPVADAAIVAAQVDGVILVVALNETRKDTARRALAMLERTDARVLGVVVNKATRDAVPYYYNGYSAAPPIPTSRRWFRRR